MSETTLNDQPPTADMLLDGAAPRLAEGPITAPKPEQRPAAAPAIELPPDAPTLPVASPVLASVESPIRPESAPIIEEGAAEAAEAEQPEPEPRDHPMAHLMPTKSQPTEASRRAAEIRAAKKAKGKKIKIGVAAGSLVVAAVVGPPLFRWLSDAINEAGNTSTEQTDG